MKKSILLFIILFIFSIVNCYAQKGEKNIGVASGFNTKTESAIVGVFFQYRISKYVRISPDLQFLLSNKNLNSFHFDGNVHFPLPLDTKITFYPLTGITYQSWKNTLDDNESKKSFGLNAGAGFDYKATNTLKISLEGAYSLMKKYSNAGFTVGISYIF